MHSHCEEPAPLDAPYINLLIVVSSPSDLASKGLAEIDVAAELLRLAPALQDVLGSRRCRVTIMPGSKGAALPADVLDLLKSPQCEVLINTPATLDAIGEHLRDKHVLHYLGHGQYVQGAGALFLEAEDGTMAIAEEDELVARLGNSQLQLVFLAACDSARRDNPPSADTGQAGEPEGGLAAALVSAGIPAVVAMQAHVTIDGAYRLTGEFYRRLFLEHGSVDLALNQARKLLYSANDAEWATPVLYTRLRSGQLMVANPLFSALQTASTQDDYARFRQDAYFPLPLHALVVNRGQQFTYVEAPDLQPTGAVILFDTAYQWLNDPSRDGTFLLLLGGPGTGKSIQLRYLAWQTIVHGLEWAGKDRFLPVFVDPQTLAAAGSTTAELLEQQILGQIKRLWHDLDAATLAAIPEHVRLRVFINGGDSLPGVADDLLKQVVELASSHPTHRFVLALQPITIDWSQFDPKAKIGSPYVLVIRPLAQRTIRQYLEMQKEYGEKLLTAIQDSYLFDVASFPYPLSKMIADAQHHFTFPVSRTTFLKMTIDEAIARLPPREGLRANAARTLRTLAWEMQSGRSMIWPINNAFDVLDRMRERRGYDLEELYTALVEAELLQPLGEDCMCFGYRWVQAYLCAEAILDAPDCDQMLEDLVEILNFEPRLRWWEETIVFVCGLLASSTRADAPKCLRHLLEPLVYGTNLLEGEAVFLAARCLVECRLHQHRQGLPDLVDHVVDALHWRTDSSNEPEWSQRLRATQLLTRLAIPEVTIQLAKVAYDKVRKNLADEADYEFSSIRFAAATVLRRLSPDARTAALEPINPQLPALFDAWNDKQAAAVIEFSKAGEDPGIQGIAALALGDLHGRLQHDEATANLVFERLCDMFMRGDTPQSVRWPVADALSGLDLTLVTEHLIHPLFENFADHDDSELRRPSKIRKTLAYLIGQLRMNEDQARRFLLDECLAIKEGHPAHDRSTWSNCSRGAWPDCRSGRCRSPSRACRRFAARYLTTAAVSKFHASHLFDSRSDCCLGQLWRAGHAKAPGAQPTGEQSGLYPCILSDRSIHVLAGETAAARLMRNTILRCKEKAHDRCSIHRARRSAARPYLRQRRGCQDRRALIA